MEQKKDFGENNLRTQQITKSLKENEKTYSTKMLGLVTLYNPNPEEAVRNIRRYIYDIETLIIWDNSPLESNLKQKIIGSLAEEADKVIWHGDGENYCIAPAVNYAWHYAMEHDYDMILLMDDDSKWEDFISYRKEVEFLYHQQGMMVFTPYVKGCDGFTITDSVQPKTLFINSGTVLPTKIITMIGGVDEKAFPLDAIDHDMAFSITELGYRIICLTSHNLNHDLGHPQRLGIFHIFTPNYNCFRTYSMTRSHIICYRKHKSIRTKEIKKYLYKEILFRKFMRIILAEPDKWNRMKAFIKGIKDGCRYNVIKMG